MKLQKNNFHTVRHYNDILPNEVCDALIEMFEVNTQGHEKINENHKPCFTQLNINLDIPSLVPGLVQYTKLAYKKYSGDIQSPYLPTLDYMEEFRIKRYCPGGEERFDEHVDVTDHASARRSVAFLFYLNDCNGNTVFPKQGLNIKPKRGKVVVFPPTWEYPHSGLAPKDRNKYILSTYIHYG